MRTKFTGGKKSTDVTHSKSTPSLRSFDEKKNVKSLAVGWKCTRGKKLTIITHFQSLQNSDISGILLSLFSSQLFCLLNFRVDGMMFPRRLDPSPASISSPMWTDLGYSAKFRSLCTRILAFRSFCDTHPGWNTSCVALQTSSNNYYLSSDCPMFGRDKTSIMPSLRNPLGIAWHYRLHCFCWYVTVQCRRVSPWEAKL